MTAPNPALEKLVARIGSELLVAQVLIRQQPRGFDLRHEKDRDASADSLRTVALGDLRALAQSSASGAFRPLKSAPTLVSGWSATAASPEQLELALNHLYPGFLADWLAAQSPAPPITHYREFTARQTGMYRITTMLADDQAAQMIRACCHSRFCLKRRLWTAPDHDADPAETKSIIPCLEPCAILLEFARKAARIAQEETVTAVLAPAELETLRAALAQILSAPASDGREADFNSPTNARRVKLLLERLDAMLPAGGTPKPETASS